jgi:hypothetical protein
MRLRGLPLGCGCSGYLVNKEVYGSQSVMNDADIEVICREIAPFRPRDPRRR